MSNTYTQIHIHAVFAVQNRHNLITETWEEELYKYISGIFSSGKHKLLSINGVPDHIHLLFGQRPYQSLSSLIQEVKANSSKWINEKGFTPCRFSWQEGFAAFSCSKSQLPYLSRYIENQKEHHSKIPFREEYEEFLKKNGIEYNPLYIIKPV